MRALFGNVGFTISVLAAVVVTTFFAFVFGAAFEIVVSMLALGLFTAIAETVMHSRQNGVGPGTGESDR